MLFDWLLIIRCAKYFQWWRWKQFHASAYRIIPFTHVWSCKLPTHVGQSDLERRFSGFGLFLFLIRHSDVRCSLVPLIYFTSLVLLSIDLLSLTFLTVCDQSCWMCIISVTFYCTHTHTHTHIHTHTRAYAQILDRNKDIYQDSTVLLTLY